MHVSRVKLRGLKHGLLMNIYYRCFRKTSRLTRITIVIITGLALLPVSTQGRRLNDKPLYMDTLRDNPASDTAIYSLGSKDHTTWDLNGFSAFQGSYVVKDRRMILLHSVSPGKGGLLWDPLFERTKHLSERDYENFEARSELLRQNDFIYPLDLKNGLTLSELESPGNTFSCQTIFSRYYEITNQDTHFNTGFYLVRRSRDSRVMKYPDCNLSATERVLQFRSSVSPIQSFFVPLGDGSFIVFLDGERFCFRLSSDRVNDREVVPGIYIIDAKPINDSLARAELGNPVARSKVFEMALTSIHR